MIEILADIDFNFIEIEPPETIILGEQEKLYTKKMLNYKSTPWIIMAS